MKIVQRIRDYKLADVGFASMLIEEWASLHKSKKILKKHGTNRLCHCML